MEGFSPADGRELRPAGGNGTKVAGVDLSFSAPKSVSVLWAVSGPEQREQIERAHSEAVASALGRIERDVELLRSRQGGELHWERAQGVLAATFVHTSSRLAVDEEQGGVPDPQLHSHVVVLGAERMNGRFAAVDSRELFRSARGNGAWYREPRAGELGSLTVATRGTKTTLAQVDVNEAWRAVAEEYGLSSERVESLYTDIDRGPAASLTAEQARDLGRQLARDVTKDGATLPERDLHARAYELSAGVSRPGEADRVLEGLVRTGEPAHDREQQREQESEVGRIMRESQEQRDREREQDRDLGYGIE